MLIRMSVSSRDLKSSIVENMDLLSEKEKKKKKKKSVHFQPISDVEINQSLLSPDQQKKKIVGHN